ncbi:MAG: tetratricopeptide repeat protein [Parachlamydia sp.]|nr:tetratricopeptide repeat protein [Parachlamydia sp.]
MRLILPTFLIFLSAHLSALAQPSPAKIRALYNSLDTTSIAQHLAFYQLYPNAPEGVLALKHTWKLLMDSSATRADMPLLFHSIDGIIALIHKPLGSQQTSLNEAELKAVEQIAARLPHRKLKGHGVWSEAEVLRLEPEEIDLARGLLLSQLSDTNEPRQQIRSYEALMDLMALQILARVPMDAAPEAKIRAINHYIFAEMGFRFPPHSLYAKDIDLYTFLPSVLDSHRGVCLGVSILYICLAQRLQLPLEMVTPPGHIYVRYRDPAREINIETTARGIHLDSEKYLGIDTRSLKQRTVKEVIGMAHFNQASVHWQQGHYEKAIAAYQKAMPYMADDMLLKELLGYNFLFTGQKEEGERLLRAVSDYLSEDAVARRTMAEDYLKGYADAEAIKSTFMEVDDNRASILKKRQTLEKVIEQHPQFRSGLMHLAITWLQLHRDGEALEVLERLHDIDPAEPTVEYYLAELYCERFDYHKAWHHLKNAERLCKDRQHCPKALKELRKEIAARCPE